MEDMRIDDAKWHPLVRRADDVRRGEMRASLLA
jgi:hypothetical protein